MADPWEDERARLKRAKETEAAFPADNLDEFVSPGAQQATLDVGLLLTDADALLAVVRASQAFRNAMKIDAVSSLDARNDWFLSLASLPERLK